MPPERRQMMGRQFTGRNWVLFWYRHYLCHFFRRITSRKIYWIPLVMFALILMVYYRYNVTPNARSKLGTLRYVINPGPCSIGSKLAILVLTDVENPQQRNIIRKTWGSYAKTQAWPLAGHGANEKVAVFFIIGYHRRDMVRKQAKIFKESDVFGDIIQANVADKRENEIQKILLAYLWTSEQCKNVKSVLIMNDRTFPNIPFILKFLRLHPIADDVILGNRVTADTFIDLLAVFTFRGLSPTYVKKDAFILSPKLATQLYRASGNFVSFKPYSKADLIATGILPEAVQKLDGRTINRLDIRKLFLTRSIAVGKAAVCAFHDKAFLFSTALRSRDVPTFWKDLRDLTIKNSCNNSHPVERSFMSPVNAIL